MKAIDAKVAQAADGSFLAWGKVGTLTDGCCALSEPGDVYFNFAHTPEKALAMVRAELRASLN